MELPAVENQHYADTHGHEQPRANKPAQQGHTEIIRTQAKVELVGGKRQHPRCARGECLALQFIDQPLTNHRRGPHQHRREVVLAHAPTEGEKGIDEDCRQAQQLDFGHTLGRLLHQW
ncbi:hypothetical protein D3C76_1547160 [compost metagenome]